MAVQPIDVQVLFSRLSQIGKEQAASKDAILQAQAAAGNEIVEKTRQQERSVRETVNIDEGPEKANDEEEKKNRKRGGNRKERHHEEEREVFQDPDIGTQVDISG
jgi:hypothetical protein